MKLIIFLTLSVFCVAYNYEEDGPDKWPYEFNQCSGHAQSPIDIQDWEATYEKSLSPFLFLNYDKYLNWNCSHNGHSVEFDQLETSENGLKFEGSNFNETFYLAQFHFHWGENDFQGSEHYIDGNKFPLEMHLVHQTKSNKTAVIAFLFQVSADESDNILLQPILEGVSTARDRSHSIKIKFRMADVILPPNQLASYYRYIGSLTTPPCTEGVYWTIFETPIEISSNQLKSFHENIVTKNFRSPQKLYKREIDSSKKERRSAPDVDAKKPQNKSSNLNGFKNLIFIFTILVITAKVC